MGIVLTPRQAGFLQTMVSWGQAHPEAVAESDITQGGIEALAGAAKEGAELNPSVARDAYTLLSKSFDVKLPSQADGVRMLLFAERLRKTSEGSWGPASADDIIPAFRACGRTLFHRDRLEPTRAAVLQEWSAALDVPGRTDSFGVLHGVEGDVAGMVRQFLDLGTTSYAELLLVVGMKILSAENVHAEELRAVCTLAVVRALRLSRSSAVAATRAVLFTEDLFPKAFPLTIDRGIFWYLLSQMVNDHVKPVTTVTDVLVDPAVQEFAERNAGWPPSVLAEAHGENFLDPTRYEKNRGMRIFSHAARVAFEALREEGPKQDETA